MVAWVRFQRSWDRQVSVVEGDFFLLFSGLRLWVDFVPFSICEFYFCYWGIDFIHICNSFITIAFCFYTKSCCLDFEVDVICYENNRVASLLFLQRESGCKDSMIWSVLHKCRFHDFRISTASEFDKHFTKTFTKACTFGTWFRCFNKLWKCSKECSSIQVLCFVAFLELIKFFKDSDWNANIMLLKS